MTPHEAPKIGPKVQLQTAFLVLCLNPDRLYSCSDVAANAVPRHYTRLRDSLSQFARSNSFSGYRGSPESGFVRAGNGRRVPAYAGAVWQRHVGRHTLQAALDIALVLEVLPEVGWVSAAEIARRSCRHAEAAEVSLRRRLLCRLWRFYYGETLSADQKSASSAWRRCLPEPTRLCCSLWRVGAALPQGLHVTVTVSQPEVAAQVGETPRSDSVGSMTRPAFLRRPMPLAAWAVIWVLGLLSLGHLFWEKEKPPPDTRAWVSTTLLASQAAVSGSGVPRGSGVVQTVLPTPSVTPAASLQPDLVLGFVPMSP